jgi:hypothetical protein
MHKLDTLDKDYPTTFCACLGTIYGEPYCPCEMRRRGLPSSPEHIRALEENEVRLDAVLKLIAQGS